MNDGNLKPYGELTETEQRELTRKGGIASGEARRRKKNMKAWAMALGELPITMVAPKGDKIEDGDLAGAVVLKQYRKALDEADTAAAAFLMRLRGEDVQKVEQVDDEVKTAAIREQLKQSFCKFFIISIAAFNCF